MATVSVLYIDDDTVGPHLELLRNVCEPSSESRPHVTVRYFDKLKAAREAHFNAKVSHIDLIEPGEFGFDAPTPGARRTVYIRCESDDLEPLDYKPHYPQSVFHITLYDGKSSEFAAGLLRVVRGFKWGFRVRLPECTTLSEIQLGARKSKSTLPPRKYNGTLKELFHSVTSEHLSWPYLVALSDKRRLQLADAICKHLHQATALFPQIGATYDDSGVTAVAEGDDSYSPAIHVTPPELARDIAEYAVSVLDSTVSRVDFGDPAVGTGEFYRALRQVLPQEQIASAIGIEISPQQVAAAQKRWSRRQLKVMRGDYLHMERLRPRTLILANPPYLRHQRIPSRYKEELRERASVNMGMRVSALSGLYVYFLLLSHAWMKEGAVAAWLIPSEFMQTVYGAAIRHYLTHRVQLVRVHQFSPVDPQFENAEVVPSVVVFRNRTPCEGQTAILSSGGTLRNPVITETVRVDQLGRESRWSIPPRLLNTAQSSGRCIEDLFVVRRGIATGANEFFIMERAKAARIGIPEVALRPLLPKARTLETDVLESEEDGYPRAYPQLCLLDCRLSEADIEAHYPRLMEYLATARALGIHDRNLVRRRRPWYAQERREPSPFLCTYMGRGCQDNPPLRFIWNKSGAIAVNTYLMLYPREGLAKLLSERAGLAAEVFALLQETARETMSEKWRTYSGGLRKVEPGDLLKVRLSSSPAWLDQAVDRLLPLK